MKLTAKKAQTLLDDWDALNVFLVSSNSDEASCEMLLETEKKNKRRKSVLERVHSTYARKRYLRERQEILAMAEVRK